MRNILPAAAFLLFITIVGFLWFPGHTYLQSDTQIYVPMLEHLRDRSVLGNDLVARSPHVAFTIYDEAALALRKIFKTDFQTVLSAQQLLFRFLGLIGVYLIATSAGVAAPAAAIISAILGLGATIVGPSVLSFEYEPVPRGFAVMLLLLAIGFAAHGRDVAAGAAAALAFLYHPPTTAPFWLVYFVLTLWPSATSTMARRIAGLVPLMAAVVVLFVCSRLQPGITEPQDFFSRISPEHEQIQRIRASYNWVSAWIGVWIWQYAALAVIAALALWRTWRHLSEDLRWFMAGLPVVGLMSVPVSYILLEGFKWSLIPQYQPARALLFVTVCAALAAALAAYHEVASGRVTAGFLWLLPAYAVPIFPRLADLFSWRSAGAQRKLLVWLLVSVGSTVAFWAVARRRKWFPVAVALAAAIPFYVIPAWAKVSNYPALHTLELESLATWARMNTPSDAVFLFPDAGKDLAPGIFRAKALRAVYVDWKSGGQVNYHRNFTDIWWERWQTLVEPGFRLSAISEYFQRGIDFIVLKPEHRIPGAVPAYANRRYVVYYVPLLLGYTW
jgi:hypothetical protein